MKYLILNMAYGIRTTFNIILYAVAFSTFVVVFATFEYALTINEFWRQTGRYHDMNYKRDGTPRFPEEHMIGWKEF